ncbi:16S rRNA (adenine(1518)-N(6)/adenine(1519)-N(6))-dimethyltransferase RsmA [Catalinimonas niigatensis]|uniref:16S rRNA (adenine(1518)-N(6)/adenine(1519)-N(6))- dimethyltransferase RsmA n=1 Tax=Catalinimonas niigatensis TaxID=1397264 RepID=UPI0026654035|nr:16S rRNA (adenine(1518)-N(6)/adenine(1519)-N(6))-dimethyltransferase RsmA [Catalinimonas niigatensis]WPP52861.1 16S rRNA (adenine(1518)-N(6)/adenine(1519)-N(6))-dimethyltransferase RsmA [Catalinimonas niigatensis]
MVRPKKHLGQHFLKDKNIAFKIVQSLTLHQGYRQVLEVGPGTGVLTQFLVQDDRFATSLIEVDTEAVSYLQAHYPDLKPRIFFRDFLKTDLMDLMGAPFAVIGNFPYNISSQIFFKILDIKNEVPEIVCMLQKEVADRLKSPPGSKAYGILSVLLQAYYDIEYLFTVEPNVFHPPPKVRSGVIRLKRNDTQQLACDEQLFRKVVKQSFQTRRKTLRNALKPLNLPETIRQLNVLDKRAEQLSVSDFVALTQNIEDSWKQEP